MWWAGWMQARLSTIDWWLVEFRPFREPIYTANQRWLRLAWEQRWHRSGRICLGSTDRKSTLKIGPYVSSVTLVYKWENVIKKIALCLVMQGCLPPFSSEMHHHVGSANKVTRLQPYRTLIFLPLKYIIFLDELEHTAITMDNPSLMRRAATGFAKIKLAEIPLEHLKCLLANMLKRLPAVILHIEEVFPETKSAMREITCRDSRMLKSAWLIPVRKSFNRRWCFTKYSWFSHTFPDNGNYNENESKHKVITLHSGLFDYDFNLFISFLWNSFSWMEDIISHCHNSTKVFYVLTNTT